MAKTRLPSQVIPAPVLAAPTSYEEVPYTSHPFPESHPDNLATVATLFGLKPRPPRESRILELGAASGGNLIPLAYSLPEAEMLGLDLAQSQVEVGQKVVKALGLSRVELRTQDIMSLDAGLGTFDYIIAHGVYSWVPPEVRDRLLELCRQLLAPQGVAFISYNTYPGYHTRQLVRDMLIFHTRDISDAKERVKQARGFLQFLAQAAPEGEAIHGVLQEENRMVSNTPDDFLFHDLLEEHNTPVYVTGFLAHARAHGLQFLGEAEFGTMLVDNFPPPVAEVLRNLGKQREAREQYMDFFYNRRLRKTLLCHQDVAVAPQVKQEALTGLRIASPALVAQGKLELDRASMVAFKRQGGGSLSVSQPLTKAALSVLSSCWPESLPFEQLLTQARARLTAAGGVVGEAQEEAGLVAGLMRGYAVGVVDLHVQELPGISLPGTHPVASPLARWQAARGTQVTNLRHKTVNLDKRLARLLTWLDGSRDLAELETLLNAEPAPAGKPTLTLEQSLKGLARGALLLA